MKFRKLLFGLAVTPFMLASCSNAVTYQDIQSWVKDHYKATEQLPAIATVYWDFHATKSNGVGMKVVQEIFTHLQNKAQQIGEFKEGVIRFPDDGRPTGEVKEVNKVNEVYPLNIDALKHFGKQDKDDPNKYLETFKIYNNALTVTSTEDLFSTDKETYIENVSCTYVYNTIGYLTGYGFKIGRHYIDSENIVKFKVTVEFEYSHYN